MHRMCIHQPGIGDAVPPSLCGLSRRLGVKCARAWPRQALAKSYGEAWPSRLAQISSCAASDAMAVFLMTVMGGIPAAVLVLVACLSACRGTCRELQMSASGWAMSLGGGRHRRCCRKLLLVVAMTTMARIFPDVGNVLERMARSWHCSTSRERRFRQIGWVELDLHGIPRPHWAGFTPR